MYLILELRVIKNHETSSKNSLMISGVTYVHILITQYFFIYSMWDITLQYPLKDGGNFSCSPIWNHLMMWIEFLLGN